MRIHHRRFVARLMLIVSLSLAPCLTSFAAELNLPKGVTKGPQAEGISEYRLANGLKVLLFPDAAKASITVNVTYLVGSRNENYGETGMAHLLEHLLFKGTPRHKNIPQQMSQRGMQFNGTTDVDRTNYYESFSANEAHLQWALAMEADRMVNSFIAQADLDSEMTVVRNEYEAGENSPQNVLFKRMMNVAFDWHNAGKSPIGNRSDIENVKITNLQAFYRTYYQPDNAVLLVAGKFDPQKTINWIQQTFGKIAKPKRSLPQFWTVEPSQDGERNVMVRRNGSTQIIAVGYKIPAALHPDTDAIQVAGDVLTNSPNGRLHKSLVETGRAAQVFHYAKSGIDPGLMVLAAVVKAGEPIEPVQKELIAALESFSAPSEDELQRFKRRTNLLYEELLNSPAATATELSEAISLGDWRLLFKGRDDIEKITADKVLAASQRYFRRDNRITVAFVPEEKPLRVEMPATPNAKEVMADFKPRVASIAKEEFDASQSNIDARTKISKIGGVKLALLPKSSRGEQVVVAMNLHWGDANNLRNQANVGYFTQSLLERGTSKFTRQQLADEKDKLKMNGSAMRFQTTRSHLLAALELSCHILRNPSFPESEFEQLKKQFKVALEQRKSNPEYLAGQALSSYFDPWPAGDIRATQTWQQQVDGLEAIRLEDIKTFYQQFYGASHGEIAIVGDFDAPAAKASLQKCFTDWPSKVSYARLENKNKTVPATRQVINTPDKENAVVLAHTKLDLARNDEDFAALMLADHIFGGDGLSSRLATRVRQKDGLSYGIGSQLGAGEIDRAGSWNMYAIVAPQNVTKLEEVIKDEVQKSLQSGFTADELAKAKSGLLQQRKLRRTDDAALASGWASLLYIDKTFAYSAELDQKIQAASLEQVNAAWRKKIQLEAISVFIAVDTAKMNKP